METPSINSRRRTGLARVVRLIADWSAVVAFVVAIGCGDRRTGGSNIVEQANAGREVSPAELTRIASELESSDPSRQKRAVEAIGTIGSTGRRFLPRLKRLAESSPDAEVKKAAARAIEMIEPPGESTPRSSP
jgi:hypothetical protein